MENYVEHYQTNARKQFEFYKLLAERSFDQVDDREFFWQYNEESNSLAIIAKHMAGNMISRWTDFLTSDGEKSWRNRDGEFIIESESRADIMIFWKKGWTCLFDAISEISEDNFHEQLMVRNIPHSVTEAVNRQIAHLAYHTGQIAYVARMIKGPDWKSLSIPKGQSEQFNADLFPRKINRNILQMSGETNAKILNPSSLACRFALLSPPHLLCNRLLL